LRDIIAFTMKKLFALAVVGLALSGCGGPGATEGVTCIKTNTDGSCSLDVVCGQTSCPDGETELKVSRAESGCADDQRGCL